MVANKFEAGSNLSATSFEHVCNQDSVMEFGFEPVCDQLRAGSSYLDMSAGSKLVADRFEAGRGPIANLLARASSLLASYIIGQISDRCRSATSFEPASNQIA